MTLNDEIDISRGDMIVRENNVPQLGQDLEVLVTWMNANPLKTRTKVIVKHTLMNVWQWSKNLNISWT